MSKEIKRVVAEIRGALDGYGREQLQEILAYVFKEYVVEGAAPAQGALAMLDARSELEGLSFAELVTWLQLHLDVPELAQLEVANGRVSLRAGGRAIPIEAAATPPQSMADSRQSTASPVPAPPPQTMPPPLSAPTVQSSTSQPALPQSPSSVPPSSPQPMPPPNAAVPSSQTPPAQPANQPASEQKSEEGNAASRFSWLEVD